MPPKRSARVLPAVIEGMPSLGLGGAPQSSEKVVQQLELAARRQRNASKVAAEYEIRLRHQYIGMLLMLGTVTGGTALLYSSGIAMFLRPEHAYWIIGVFRCSLLILIFALLVSTVPTRRQWRRSVVMQNVRREMRQQAAQRRVAAATAAAPTAHSPAAPRPTA
jgi:heme exporter protein D